MVDHTSIQNFLQQMDECSVNKELIIALKNPGVDQNGLNQILTSNQKQRIVEFDKSFSKLCETDSEIESIVIVSDIFLSGQQTEKAFKHYFSPNKTDEDKERIKDEVEKEKYYPFSEPLAKENFINKLKSLKKIVFMAPFISEKFDREILSILKRVGINASVESKHSGSLRSNEDCFFSDCIALNVTYPPDKHRL